MGSHANVKNKESKEEKNKQKILKKHEEVKR